MSESYDKEVEYAMIHGIPVEEHLADLRLQPIKEGSRLTNDVLQVALAQHYNDSRAIEHLIAETQEKAAYALVKEAEAHLARANDWWETCSTRVRLTVPEN